MSALESLQKSLEYTITKYDPMGRRYLKENRMRIATIWDRSINFTLKERFWRTWNEWALPNVARSLPARLRYWVLITEGVNNVGNDVVPEVAYVEILKRSGNRLKHGA